MEPRSLYQTFDKTVVYGTLHAAAQYDLVIADYRMPGGITGIDLAKIVKKHASKTKVFLMTAFDISSSPELRTFESKIVDESFKNLFQKDKLIAIIEKTFLHNNH